MLLGGVFSTASLARASVPPPMFLIPAFAATQTSSFSTTASRDARKDGNPKRGLSALNRKMAKKHRGKNPAGLDVSLATLPKPVLDPSKRSKVEVDEDHGLWEFFNESRTAMPTPEELSAHGNSWTVQQLRRKDWDDLHRLWWVCLKELNRINTAETERSRAGKMYGEHEASERHKTVQRTMKHIKATLTERWYAWDNARHEAMEDDEINMYADLEQGDSAYLPKAEESAETQGQDVLPLPEAQLSRPAADARV